jgi:uncharacterized membrane protein (UPF0182 family)
MKQRRFPRDRLIYGPKQIDARINQDSFISQQLTLWNQRGSEVIRGSLLVIPIEKSLLYVQPLFLAADKAGLPELKRVIVAFGDQVVMEENLELALQRLFGAKNSVAAVTASATADLRSSPASLAKEAMGIYEKATSLQRQGNWAGLWGRVAQAGAGSETDGAVGRLNHENHSSKLSLSLP